MIGRLQLWKINEWNGTTLPDYIWHEKSWPAEFIDTESRVFPPKSSGFYLAMANMQLEGSETDNLKDSIDLAAVDRAPGDNPALTWQESDPIPGPINEGEKDDKPPDFPNIDMLSY